MSESLAARNNIQGIFAPKNARNMPPFSRQRFVANLCPTANLSGNTLLRCDTTHKAKNSFNALYKNELDGENLSSDLRQTFVASTANLPDKAHLLTFNTHDFPVLAQQYPHHGGLVLAAQQSWTLSSLIAALDRLLSETEAADWLGQVRWLHQWRRART